MSVRPYGPRVVPHKTHYAIGFELVLLVDLFGVELFLISFLAPIWFYWHQVESMLANFDRFFFLAAPQQICSRPALIAHAIPGYLPLLFGFAGITVIAS